jgi:methionyl-tRNA formyltransferase
MTAHRTPLRLIFAGTPEFSVPTLSALLQSEHQVVAVLTQPDRPKGRGQQTSVSPVKVCAQAASIPVLQPTTLRCTEIQQTLRAFTADIMVVVAYGLIVPPVLLSMPQYGCINIHASLLPRFRGASPITQAILAGDERTGISLMRMDEGCDTGPVYGQVDCAIEDDMTTGSLGERLATLGTPLLMAHLAACSRGIDPVAQPQPSHGVCLAPKLKPSHAQIDWSRPAEEIARQVRAYQPWPTAWSFLHGPRVKVLRAHVVPAADPLASQPGEVIAVSSQGMQVGTGHGILCITEVQWPGGRAMSLRECWHQQRLNLPLSFTTQA